MYFGYPFFQNLVPEKDKKEKNMPKSITRQIQDLQSQNKKLRELDRLFEKAIKMEFGLSRAEIHTLINASTEPQQDKLG